MIRSGRDNHGFTLIELMIVIAIIGILAAIAIPNFIAYRNKAFCSAAESDVRSISAGLGDYFSIAEHATLPTQAAVSEIILAYGNNNFSVRLSRFGQATANTGTVSGTVDNIYITVTDGSGRCPADYRLVNRNTWTGEGGAADGSDWVAYKRMILE
ncbi:MAG: prepilin-type N-terminal cleavage/methylation domain-containing protein [Thermodesulfobacteriota bacterium]